jgi:arginyl-tRNA synthetase
MSILAELKNRFAPVLRDLTDDAPNVSELLDMIRPAQDAKFGDYQANFAMPLKARLDRPPREIAQEVVDRVDVRDICEAPEIAGPGFINLRIKDVWLVNRLGEAMGDERLGVSTVESPRAFVVDYSAPNVAKPMHVGHIRSTVIGDSVCRTLRFLGHQVVSDNHIGDWGTQFGMIIYGYKHFLDAQAYEENAVAELARLYKLVRKILDYWDGKKKLPASEQRIAELDAAVETAKQKVTDAAGDKKIEKKAAKELRRAEAQLADAKKGQAELATKIAEYESTPEQLALATAHAKIGQAVLEETAKLHADDPENIKLWKTFMPACRDEIERVYGRLDIKFDYEYGESFYHNRLAPVVKSFKAKGLAEESDGAQCVFFDEFDTPMIIQKRDGAFLYATTDLATIQYRLETWQPDAILYVVDHRQSEHFGKLFAAARQWLADDERFKDLELTHVKFGTVLGEDGRPFKTRAGDTVGLEGLLDEAVARALKVVSENDDKKPDGAEFSEGDRQTISETVGIAALKYADLSQNRESDYVFSYDKMLALNGNTATYMQYAYARVRNIFARGDIDVDSLKGGHAAVALDHPAERALALELLKFADALESVVADYRPNQLTSYLFDLADKYSTFYQNCPVLKADTETRRNSRLLLCDLTARTLKQGLALLGISVIEKM